jgi:hypothetical protein
MARQAADQAKNFALVSATVYGTDLFDTFLRNLAAETWLGFRSETVHVVGRHGSGPGGHEYSMRERALTLYTELGFEADMLPSTLELMEAMVKNGISLKKCTTISSKEQSACMTSIPVST